MSKLEQFLTSQHSLSSGAKRRYCFALKLFVQESGGKPFEDVFLDSVTVHTVLGKMEKQLKPSTWNGYLQCYKRYAKWLSDTEDLECPVLWRKISQKRIDWEKALKDKWLSEEEFLRMMDVADHPRDKALLGVSVEGALRAGELLSLRVGDCEPTAFGEQNGFKVTVSGKTGTGSFPVVLFAPALESWLNHHPCKNDPKAPLWVRRKSGRFGNVFEGIRYGNVARIVRTLADRADIKRVKPVTPHWLRHTKITWTYRQRKFRVSDEAARKAFRWRPGSSMPSRYAHLTGADSDDLFLALAGVEKSEVAKATAVFAKKKCPRCSHENLVNMLFCQQCGSPLQQEAADLVIKQRRLLDLLSEVLDDPRRLEKFREQLRSL